MPRKIQNAQINPLDQDDVSDDEIQIPVAPKQVSQLEPATQEIQQQPAVVPAVPVKKAKRNYTCTDEHKEVLRQRLQLAHQKKQELAQARQAEKQEALNALEMKKQEKILQEAEKLKRKENKMLNDLTVKEIKPKKVVAPVPAPAPVVRNKKKVVMYITDSEDDDDEEEEEEIFVKPKQRKQPAPAPAPVQKPARRPAPRKQQYYEPEPQQPVYQQPTIQPIKWNIC